MADISEYSPARRAVLSRLALTGAAGAGGMAGLLQAALAANPQSGMRSLRGTVSIDGKPALPGQQVEPGQTVVTGDDGEAVFVIGSDAFLQRGGSIFTVETNGGVAVLRYISGKLLSVFGKGRKTLVTPTATIGIRGTACYIEAEPVRTYFCLCYGSALLTPNAEPNKRRTIRTRHHEYPLYIDTRRGPLMVAPADVINHSDAELVMLEALVGRVPPFHGKAYPSY